MTSLSLQRQFTEEEWRDILLGSYMAFLQYFFKLKNGKPFKLSEPIGRQSHFLTIRDELEKVFKLETNRLIINVPPGYAKSTMLVYFVAWCIAHYPDCNFLYISYSFELAEKHTATIKEIITMPAFRYYFGVELRNDSKSRSNFKTTAGGITRAFGAGGSVTGQDGGLPNLDRFSGAVIIDDPIKPDDAHSELIRDNVIRNYMETIKQRVRGPNVPILFIGQRLHEGDLAQHLLDGKDGQEWKHVVLKALDNSGNALDPDKHDVKWLRNEEKYNRYVYWSQYQQQPIPDGGGIFDKNDFILMDLEPAIISTFMTIDTAETNKDWNDATAMSFWGIYRIEARGIDTGLYGLHWLDCREIRVEPKDLEPEFFDFYANCMRHKVKPVYLAIEKASTGVTLSSILKSTQGLKVIDVIRTKASGSKTARYYEAQPYVARGQISFTKGAKHVEKCIAHMSKITSNDSHMHDDIADTMQMSIQCALIEGTLLPKVVDPTNAIKNINDEFKAHQHLHRQAMQWDY